MCDIYQLQLQISYVFNGFGIAKRDVINTLQCAVKREKEGEERAG